MTGGLRILFVSPYVPAPRHGGGVHLYELIRRLARRHGVGLVALEDQPPEPEHLAELQSLCRPLYLLPRIDYPLGRLEHPLWPRTVSRTFGHPSLRTTVSRVLASGEFNILQFNILHCAGVEIGPQIPCRPGVGRVLTEYEVQHAGFLNRLRRAPGLAARALLAGRWLQWLWAELEQCRRFHEVVAFTAEDAQSLTRYDRRLRPRVIPIPVDAEHYQPGPGPEKPGRLLFVGNFRHTPNADAAAFLANEILGQVRSSLPDIELQLVGGDAGEEVRALGRIPGVTLAGWVNDLRPSYDQAALFLAPLRLGMGMRVKVLEALAMGKAVVATRLACHGLEVSHGRQVWLAETAEEFAAAIRRLLADAGLRRQLGQAGRELVLAQHGWEETVRRHEAVYESALRQARPAAPRRRAA